jgi:WD40 repeat protein/tRNA A-37 threonylcarbamoyl transferase component Bud32
MGKTVAEAGKQELQTEWMRLQPEEAGQRIGHYKLLEQIGEGGFGVVWVAEQLEPVRRRVALKIIKPGMDSRQVIARFEQERQALAMMDHPNIAKVFDAGATDKGRPYFVMELVRGVKITGYCDRENLPTAERLKLLITVCQAVQHAHQKGIIHRDLKPSNILVTPDDDGEPVPKVIDFGVAKAIQQQALTDATVYTQFEQMIGTPAYMSPEQAGLGPMDVDTRSDVYSLGVLLYELLTGRPPFDPKELLSAGLDEMRRVIREVEPPKPSTRVSSLSAEQLSGTAAHRHVEPPKLISAIRGDLDWIAMKALEKNRSRRYESATGLAADIQRYLANQPVTAAAPGAAYLFRKFARRHQASLGLAALISVVLVAATAISLWQAKLAIAAKKETANALGEVEKQKTEVDRKNAEQRAMLTGAARSDRAVADGMLRAGLEREAFAHLARACDYDPLSTFAGEKAVVGLNTWQHPLPLAILTGHDDRVADAQFSQDTLRIVTASFDNTVRVWDAATGRSITTLAGHEGGVVSAQFSPDGLRIVTASWDKTARVWDATTGQCLATLVGHEKALGSAQFSPDGLRIVTASDDATSRVWDAAMGKSLATLNGHSNAVLCAQFSSDGSRIVTASLDKTARVWDATTGKCLATLEGHEGRVNKNSAQFSPDGSRIVTASLDKTVPVWDAATGKCLTTLAGHEDTVVSAQFSLDGLRIVTASWDKTARLWDAATGKCLATLVGHESRVNSAQFSPDGLRIVTASNDKTARVWDSTTGKCLAPLVGHADYVISAQFSPDSLRIVTASWDKTARVWDASTRTGLTTLVRLEDRLKSTLLSPNGLHNVTVYEDNVVRICERATGKCLTTLAGHEGSVNSAQFSQDGLRIVTASSDKTARVWDSTTGKCLATLVGHESRVNSAQFSPDGLRIVTASVDKTARLWDVDSGKCLATLTGYEFGDKIGVLALQFTEDGLGIETALTGGFSRVWTILPATAGPPPAWFAAFLRYLAQMRLNSDGELETLKPADWLALRERMRAVSRASKGQDTPYLRILRRYVPE